MRARIVIVGGGLAGLHAAALLETRGITDYVLLEARNRFGGRLHSERVPGAAHAAGSCVGAYDLGATWFWPDLQPEFARFVADLGVETFAQCEEGDMVVERGPSSPPERMAGYLSSPPARRVAGGMAALVSAIAQRIPSDRLRPGCTVRAVRVSEEAAVVEATNADGAPVHVLGAHVLMAVPPRLTAASIRFEPSLPEQTMREWARIPTWMAPHAKYVAVYDTPFWRARGLSGAARSFAGPLGEIHDASGVGSAGALFGFFAVPAAARARTSDATLRALCRAQLVRLFGPDAGTPRADFVKDWAADPLTATETDRTDGNHPHAPATSVTSGPWAGRLVGVASEWSPEYSGYVAGAVDAARRGVSMLGLS